MKTVFLAASPSIIKWAYQDVIESDTIEYCQFESEWNKGIKKYFFTRKVAAITPYFLKKHIYRHILNYRFLKETKKNEEILFVFTCQYGMFTTTTTFFQAFIRFLKRSYPKAKFAFYYNDIVSTCFPEFLEAVKSEFDLTLSFDRQDAEKYGLQFYEEIYSKNEIVSNDDIKPFDVFFVGSDRGRLKTILEVFKKVADLDQRAIFYLFDVLPENEPEFEKILPRCQREGEQKITYRQSVIYRNVYCPYPQTLAHIEKCKCLVEITLPVQTSPTLRIPESVVYGKKIITNCYAVRERVYYKPENMLVFEDLNKIEDQTLKHFLDTPPIPNDYDFSPLKMIAYIQSELYK